MDKLWRFLRSVCLIVCVILVTSVVTIIYVQPYLFFHPWHNEEAHQQLKQISDFQEIEIDNNGKKLSGWMKYNSEKEIAPLVIFFLGNADNSSNTCLVFFNRNIYKYFDDYNLLVVDYPGYGISEGKTSERTMFDAALKVYDYATELEYVDKNNIVVLGYSIGTGVATYVSLQRPINGLILVSPYDEALSLYNDNVNIFYGPIKLLARYKFNSLEYAKSIKVAPLIITSYDDEVIDYKFSLNLANNFNDVYQTIILDENVKHSNYFAQEKVLNSIYEYLQDKHKV